MEAGIVLIPVPEESASTRDRRFPKSIRISFFDRNSRANGSYPGPRNSSLCEILPFSLNDLFYNGFEYINGILTGNHHENSD